MKKVLIVFLFLLAIGCKTKSVTVDKTAEKERENYARHFDSLFKLTQKLQLDWQKSQASSSNNLVLTSTPVLDSLGNRKPLIYKHYVDGALKEEIYLEGGEMNRKTESNETKETGKINENKAEKTAVKVNVGQELEKEKSTFKKGKAVEVTGFQFGAYLWWWLLIIALVILGWIAKRFKLLGRFKSLLNPQGGNIKPSDI